MIKQVVVYKDRIVVDLYQGRQATGYLVAVTTSAQNEAAGLVWLRALATLRRALRGHGRG